MIAVTLNSIAAAHKLSSNILRFSFVNLTEYLYPCLEEIKASPRKPKRDLRVGTKRKTY
jgi:hypothetical protein